MLFISWQLSISNNKHQEHGTLKEEVLIQMQKKDTLFMQGTVNSRMIHITSKSMIKISLIILIVKIPQMKRKEFLNASIFRIANLILMSKDSFQSIMIKDREWIMTQQ